MLGQIATLTYTFSKDDCVEYISKKRVVKGTVRQVNGHVAEVRSVNQEKTENVNVRDLCLLYDGTTYGSLENQKTLYNIAKRHQNNHSQMQVGDVVIVQGETHIETEADPEYWLGIIRDEDMDQVGSCYELKRN